jgi:[ribosomal protein S5]-alanine N-acetyltransferase
MEIMKFEEGVSFVSVIYETDRLLLCLLDESTIEAVKDFWGNEEVMSMCNGSVPHDFLVKVINGYRKCHEEKGISVYGVIEKESGTIIGAAGFNVPGDPDSIELIYHFRKQSWGKGYASEAANACLEIAKNHGKIQTVFASADYQNKSSLKILEKIGFIQKGSKWFEDTKQEEPYYEYII